VKKRAAFIEAAFFRALLTNASQCESRIKASMKNIDLNAKSVEELWALHEEIASILAAKIQAETVKLEKRLHQLRLRVVHDVRRPYPEVQPKFRNPNPPHQTWSGRGKQPVWMRQVLADGVTTMDDLRI
jgi:DNA-binding protein H-NS